MGGISDTRTIDSVLASTLERRAKGYISQVGSQCPLWYWLREKKRYKAQDGGNRIERAVEYALNTDEPSFAGYDTLEMGPTDDTTILIANWKQYHKAIVISGEEKRKNSGMRVFNLLEQKEKNAVTSLINQFNDHVYLDGTGHDSKRITGLQAICAWAPTTGTLFGLNRETYSWWRNREKDTNAAAWDTTNSVATMRDHMNVMYRECGRTKVKGQRYPDFIIGTETYWDYYCGVTEKIGRRFVDPKVANSGWDNAKFRGAVLVADEDCPDSAGSEAQGYFLNSDFLELVYHPQANMTLTKALRFPEQDAFVRVVLWMGALICTNCAKQGVHFGLTAQAG